MKFPSILFICVVFNTMNAQTAAVQNPFPFEEFRLLLNEYHPLARQAGLQIQKGESQVRKARGNFDPKIEAAFSDKNYQGKDYYNINSATVKIPTIAAAELKGGFDLNSGSYLDPQDFTPNNGLITAGISLPLLQGLMIDERRATLKIAKAYNEFSKLEKEVVLNDLRLRAYTSYFEWWAAYEKVNIASDMQRLAADRFLAVRARALAGQSPIIDTVEAYIQVQLRTQFTQESRVSEVKSRLNLSSFIWEGTENPQPRILSSFNTPVLPTIDDDQAISTLLNLNIFLDSIEFHNPYLAQFEWKFESLSFEEKWKKEKMKPKLNVNYNALSFATSGATDLASQAFSTRNYKWGLDFSFPLLLRESKGDLQLQKIKIQETQWDYVQKTQEFKNKARTAYENIRLYNDQLTIAKNNLGNFLILLEGERTRFFNGESSLFLVNQREIQFIDGRTKIIELELKIKVLSYELLYWIGLIE